MKQKAVNEKEKKNKKKDRKKIKKTKRESYSFQWFLFSHFLFPDQFNEIHHHCEKQILSIFLNISQTPHSILCAAVSVIFKILSKFQENLIHEKGIAILVGWVNCLQDGNQDQKELIEKLNNLSI